MHIQLNEPLSLSTYYRIGGNAEILLQVTNLHEVFEALAYVKTHQIHSIHVLGLGANAIIPDEGLAGVVICMQSGNDNFTLTQENQIVAFAGATLDELIKYSFANNLVGLGWAGGLPSSIGGAIRGNVGCFGSEIESSIISVEWIDTEQPENGVQRFIKKDCEFAYRDSYFKQHPNLIIVSVTFSLQSATFEQMKQDEETYHRNIVYRQKNHPMDYPSCGSVFKNIIDKKQVTHMMTVWPELAELVQTKWYEKIAMAYVIGKLGFAGYTVGDAQVSEKHTNYIVNLGHATAKDVQTIISEVRNKFMMIFGFEPTLEVEVVK